MKEVIAQLGLQGWIIYRYSIGQDRVDIFVGPSERVTLSALRSVDPAGACTAETVATGSP